jgi:hypothetical protein
MEFLLGCFLTAHAYFFLKDVVELKYNVHLLCLPQAFNSVLAQILP